MRPLHRMPRMLLLFLLLALGCSNEKEGGYSAIVEGTTIQVPAMTGGKIQSVLTAEGATVASGALLAIIDTTELVLQRAQLSAALAELSGQTQLAQTQLAQARHTESYMQKKQERVSRLVSNNAAAQQSLDDLTLQLQQAQTARESARQNFLILNAKKEQLHAQLGLVRKRLNDAHITSPAAGIISEVYYETGEAIPAMAAIVEVVQIDPVEIKIFVSEMLLSQVQYGQEVKIFADGHTDALTGKISWISPKAEFTPKNILTPETRTSLVYAITIRLQNPDHILKHGMPVTVTL